MTATSDPTILVVFGATGDLMTRKIVPSLAYLYMRGRLPEQVRVIGFSRRDWSDQDFRGHVAGILDVYDGAKPEGTHRDRFLALFAYQEGTFEDDQAYKQVADRVGEIDAEWGVCGNKLFYLAVPPEFYRDIFERLAASGLTKACSAAEGWTRVLVEKPFGKDVSTARALDELLGTLFREEQIYRIDHYLAKEMLQGILNFRFSNNLFETSWDTRAIERIDISILESLGVESRGAFYDGVGALRDVGQNHLLQMLALVTMDQPVSLGPAAVRSRRAEAVAGLRRLTPEQVRAQTYRAQFLGYPDTPGVAEDSSTETYFKLRMTLADERWRGVPVTLESGKRMGQARKEIVVTFRHPHPCLCADGEHRQNQVIFTLEPTESIKIVFWAKRPGLDTELEERRFDFFLYEKEETAQYVEEYAKLLLDAIVGDQTLFVSTDEVRSMWEFIDAVTTEWAEDMVPLETYPPDTRSAAERAEEVLRAHEEAAVLEVADGGAAADAAMREIGFVGLGKMGAGLARSLLGQGWRVVGYNRTPAVAEALEPDGLAVARSLEELVGALEPPRVVWVMVPAGDPVERVLFGEDGEGGVSGLLSEGDVVIDGGNSFYRDTAGRSTRLADKGIELLDAGTSGGPEGARDGACLMVGGRREAFDRLEPLWNALAVEGGYQFFEGSGAGHFVKMVHNGIEYGMMQAIAEGFDIMRLSELDLDLARIADVYDHGSVIESRLIEWLGEVFAQLGQQLEGVSGSVGHTGEAAWTVRVAEELGAEVRVIRGALEFREESESDPSYAGRILTALRDRFGGHGLGRTKAEAQTSTEPDS